jgi:hypothetical protein
MAEIRQEEYLVNEEQKTEGYMVAVEADTYEEARAIAYQRWAEKKPEVQERMLEERNAELALLDVMLGM